MVISSARDVERIAARLAPRCAKCGGRVASVSARATPTMDDGFEVVLACHGAVERYSVSTTALISGDLSEFPIVAFLQIVARYGQVSPEARRERRASR